MKRTWVIPFICITMLCMGCAGSKKMRVPLAEIDRPIVDPMRTWAIHPVISYGISAQDTIVYKGISFWDIIFPSYSITNAIAIPYIPFPYLIWQLTKSPCVDTAARYKWQAAVSGGVTGYGATETDWDLQLFVKKRISPSVWYSGTMGSYFGRFAWTGTHAPYLVLGNDFGFQLSPKADVVTGITLLYRGNYQALTRKESSASGHCTFHYTFSPWFGLDVGSGIGTLSPSGTGCSLSVGGDFYW